jgi:WD40 repeat protein
VRVWDTVTGDELRIFKGHGAGAGGGVLACAVSPDGSWVVSGADDKKVLIWDTTNLDLPPIAEPER